MNWLSLAIKAIPYILAAILGGLIVWGIMSLQVNTLKHNNAVLKDNNLKLVESNEANVLTIKRLKEENVNLSESCKQRIIVKEKVITRIQKIETMKGASDEEKKDGVSPINNDILDALNQLYLPPASSDGVRKTSN